ncbi:hypothetical protein TWF569_001927 [Orbilia oligospora]|uniref:Phytocyanin domain-containing protein n=1 Tax=Orbilia oligospora TaxID=2813651 RepID=A0A7C8NHH5_ORBOL|nr:hypothetical protein TWF706_006328 [Orbilia oligospora]KAF3104922.1 hypothetical protein TWF102_002687 [Orbilia oligospora]KAF3116158.1 hypothetical protein TWF103_009384 [Orbilia oligospora]KAF3137866.1 hypothetical protein TWF703_004836 [Orbilia oligospora]KAF3153615.1 hypothetical protein TWF569_001927 [Orbilia oligospora]
MRFLLTLATFASTVLAQTVHTVSVGSAGLTFSPDSITAKTGDTVQFVFKGGNHTVTQAAFSSPCNPTSRGFSSGFTGSRSESFSIILANTDPIYFYCAQLSHCQLGMVGAINPPSSGNTLAAFKSAATNARTQSTPSSPFGGVISIQGGAVSTAPGAVQSGGGATTRAATNTGGAAATSSTSSSGPKPTGNGVMALTGDMVSVVMGVFGAAALLV